GCSAAGVGGARLELGVGAAPAGSVEVGRPVQSRLTVTNAGTAPADGVTVTAEVPAQLQVTGTEPKARQVGQRWVFDLGTAPAGMSQSLTVTAVAKAAGELHFKAEAR